MDPAGVISGLRPCIIKGGEESLGGAAGDKEQDTLGGVEVCGGVDSISGDDTLGGPGADMGDSDSVRAAETRGGVEALVRDVNTAAGDAES